MKTERNGILETAWRKFKAFTKTPLSYFLLSVLWLYIFAAFVAFGMLAFPSEESIPWFVAAGFSLSILLNFFFSFMNFLFDYKPSAEADKNKNENKDD